jgi:hypothetical protein
MGYVYLGLAFLGAVAPYAFLGQILASGRFSLHDLRLEALANPVSSYLAVSLLVALLVSLVFIAKEGRRLKMKGLWLPLLAVILIGVSCGLPLFLFMRQLNICRREALAAPAPEEPVLPPPPPPPAARPRGGRR